MSAIVVELLRRAYELFVNEGLSGDRSFGAVEVLIVAGSEFPDDEGVRDLGGRDDDCGDGKIFFEINEGEFLNRVFLIVPLDRRHQKRRLSFGVEVSSGYSRAFAWMIDPEDLRIVA